MDKLDKQDLATRYGFALAFMRSDPELSQLFKKAVNGTWTPDKFIARLRNTDWFKHHSADVRNAILQETADPATYKANVAKMFATVRDTMGSMYGPGYGNPRQMKAWAETAHRMGWSESQLRDRITEGINYRKLLNQHSLGGQAAQVASQLDIFEKNYGVSLGKQWKAKQLERVMEGGDTLEGIQKRIRDLSMREYKAFADRLAAGETMTEIADPYVQKMASLLELNPNEVSLNNKKIQEALKQRDDKGRPAAMDLHSFEDFVRKDKRWAYTDQAREQVSGLTSDLLRNFGLLSG